MSPVNERQEYTCVENANPADTQLFCAVSTIPAFLADDFISSRDTLPGPSREIAIQGDFTYH